MRNLDRRREEDRFASPAFVRYMVERSHDSRYEDPQSMLYLAVLAHLGFPRFDATGEPFDPARHEAVGVIDSDASPGTVVAAVRPGYGSGDSVLRPAGVVVARARPSHDEDDEGADGRSGA